MSGSARFVERRSSASYSEKKATVRNLTHARNSGSRTRTPAGKLGIHEPGPGVVVWERTAYEVVSSVWGVTSTWTVKARSLPEASRKASEELRERSYGAYIVSVRRVDA
jgi:hypothetical protein